MGPLFIQWPYVALGTGKARACDVTETRLFFWWNSSVRKATHGHGAMPLSLPNYNQGYVVATEEFPSQNRNHERLKKLIATPQTFCG